MEREAPKGYTTALLPILGMSESREDHRSFDGLNADGLAEILAAAPHLADQTQNDSPSMAEFLALGRKYPGLRFHGYVIGQERTDERVSVEGWVGRETPNICADEGLRPDEISRTRAWWD
jgi:hypothetical protein